MTRHRQLIPEEADPVEQMEQEFKGLLLGEVKETVPNIRQNNKTQVYINFPTATRDGNP